MTTKCLRPNLGFVALLAMLAMPAMPAANAVTWHVATTGNDANPGTQAQPFQTIGHGIAAADNGDTVLVSDGAYSEHGLDFGSTNLTLRSQSGNPAACVLDGQKLGAAIRIAGGQTSAAVSGFTIRNGYASANYTGAAITIRSAAVSVINCILSGNEFPLAASGGDAIYVDVGSNASIANCTFSGNGKYAGYPVYTLCAASGSTTVTNCAFSDNGTSAIGAFGGACTITGCAFTGNSGGFGGAIDVEAGSVTASACVFRGNRSKNGNCQVFVYRGGLNLIDSLIADGTGTLVALAVEQVTASLTNCTIAGGANAVLRSRNSGRLALANTIVWGFSPGSFGAILLTGGTADAMYSDIQGGYAGTGNINADPLFASTAAGNYHLQTGSPCINAGSASAPGLPTTDLDGSPRIMGAAPDMGAYEAWTPDAGLWFVDKALGSDTAGTGSPTAPFQTVVKAIDSAGNGNSIYIKQGNYGTDKPRITRFLHLYNWQDTGWARIGKP